MSVIKYLYRLVTDWSISPLLSEAYQLSMSIPKSWCSEVKKILDNIGFSEVWLYPMRASSISVNELSERLHDQYLKGWSSSLKCTTGHGKLRTYKSISSFRSPLDQIQRISANPLRIEVGHYHRPNPLPVEDRLCQMCNLSTVEDELHFLLHCSLYYKDIISKLLDLCRTYHQSFQHLSLSYLIMTIKNLQILSSLAHFVSQAFSIRARAQPPQQSCILCSYLLWATWLFLSIKLLLLLLLHAYVLLHVSEDRQSLRKRYMQVCVRKC